MPVEIDENQLAGLRGLKGFVEKAMAHPEHRRTLLKVQKELYPDIAVPELDAANPVLDEVTKLREAFEADKKAREEEAAKRNDESAKSEWEKKWAEGRSFLKTKHKYNDEGIEAVEKLMIDRNIPDHEAGLALFEKMNPPPPPALTGSSRFGWFDDANNEKRPDVQRLFNKDYDGFLAEAIDSARRDFRSGGQTG
jgi:hypothetical protein